MGSVLRPPAWAVSNSAEMAAAVSIGAMTEAETESAWVAAGARVTWAATPGSAVPRAE